MLNRFFSLLFIVLLFSSCSLYHVNSQEVTEEYYPAKASADEVVFLEMVDRPHDVIGYVTVNAERNQKMDEIILKMKKEAAMLGADAITKVESDATGSWKHLPAQRLTGQAYIRANFRAEAVVFK